MDFNIVQISISSVATGDDIATTVAALLDDGRIIYTGLAQSNEWHELDPPAFGPAGKLDT